MRIMGERMKRLGIDKLETEEQLALLDELWESLSQDPISDAIPDWHRTELRRRVATFEANPDPGQPFEEVIADIRRGK